MPAEVGVSDITRPVPNSVIVTFAPGRTAPEASITVPSMLPIGACAVAQATAASRTMGTRNVRFKGSIGLPPPFRKAGRSPVPNWAQETDPECRLGSRTCDSIIKANNQFSRSVGILDRTGERTGEGKEVRARKGYRRT